MMTNDQMKLKDIQAIMKMKEFMLISTNPFFNFLPNYFVYHVV